MFYTRSSRQLKRLEAISRSPILAFFQESYAGASTIRVFKRVDAFVDQFNELVDRNAAVQMCHVSAYG